MLLVNQGILDVLASIISLESSQNRVKIVEILCTEIIIFVLIFETGQAENPHFAAILYFPFI